MFRALTVLFMKLISSADRLKVSAANKQTGTQQKHPQRELKPGNKEIMALHGEPEENLECQLTVGKMDYLNSPPITKQHIGRSID